MKIHLIIAASLASTSCNTYPRTAVTCRGVIDLDGIRDMRLRQDAHETVIQFTALDENISVTNASTNYIFIKGRGSSCSDFGRSFTQSPMEEFKGLTYNDIAAKS